MQWGSSPHTTLILISSKMKIGFLNESTGRYAVLNVIKIEGDNVFVDQGMNSFTASLAILREEAQEKICIRPKGVRQFPLVKLHGFK